MANISLRQLEEMFQNMQSKSGWNTDGDLLWGYFFNDRNPKNLEPLGAHLTKLGYRFVSIYETDDGSTNFLHVERIEAHTPTSLFALNTQMNELAEKLGVESYDGMDVGPVPARPT